MKRRTIVSTALGGTALLGASAAWLFSRPGAPAAEAATPPPQGGEMGLGDLVRGPGAVVLGNPAGDVTIIEFFDYRCPYCRRMHPMLKRLLAEDHGIRFVAKEWPVFGGPSVTAAKIALAADWQGNYAAVHQALMEHEGTLDEAKVRALAEQAGADMARMDADLSGRGAELDAMLGQVAAQAHALGLRGTPSFIIGTYLVPGALAYDDLVQVVGEARTKAPSRG
ncbi:DsbA family protein [Roseomonas sp. E05]|uniref:DsbA family protein n=1 Tax=Roseomonas sp. E05 TaxID=3046310 RepID=UPI0024BB869D|nr:DsbA family protein [Roseomonas sp. E05]MDJ0391138.1 DsbA family protein [Roseomonas sp. E05]